MLKSLFDIEKLSSLSEMDKRKLSLFKRLLVFNLVAITTSLLTIFFSSVMDIRHLYIFSVIYGIQLISLYILRKGNIALAGLFHLVTSILLSTCAVIFTGVTNGTEYTLLIYMLLALFLFDKSYQIAFILLLCFTSYFITDFLEVFINVGMEPFPENKNITFLLFSIVMVISTALVMNYIREIRGYQLKTEQLVAEVKKNNALLEEANQELEQFNRIASHDLKTPLRTINSFVGLMERKIARGEYQELPEHIGYVKEGASRMYQLIDDVGKVTKLNNSAASELEEVDLNELVVNVKNSLLAFTKEKGGEIISNRLPTIRSSRQDVFLVFQNFVHNGLKYNESSKPKVELKAIETDDFHEILFTDNGIGIKEEYHSKVFNMFERLHTKNQYEGTGMGLAICKRIIEKLGGKIHITSEEAKGTTFKLSLPKY